MVQVNKSMDSERFSIPKDYQQQEALNESNMLKRIKNKDLPKSIQKNLDKFIDSKKTT